MLSNWCIYFEDGTSQTVLAKSKVHIREQYKNVRSVFIMNRKFVVEEKRVDDLS
jgi:hypothetical protein